MPFRKILLLLLFACLLGCGGSEVKEAKEAPPPPPTRVAVSIQVGTNSNPDAANRASPLLFRIYQLKDLANFHGADFFAVYGKEQEAFGGDLVRKQEFMLIPGETKTLAFEAEPDTRFLGVFAAFRNLEAATWRASTAIPRIQTTVVEVQVEDTQISLMATQKPTDPEVVP